MLKQELEKLKEEFREVFWAYHFRKNTKLNDKQSKKRLKELADIFDKEGITTI
ncbi:unnamed protein product [marine sediment metagenome]|uniref:Uncharacterized protein n=1 Tax=marine sediment metagenome TaxID=412755 RepID=X0ZQV9_9ZZZZ